MKTTTIIATLTFTFFGPFKAAGEPADVLEIGNFQLHNVKPPEKINPPKWTPKDAPVKENDDEIKKLSAMLHGQPIVGDKDENNNDNNSTSATSGANNGDDKMPMAQDSQDGNTPNARKSNAIPDFNAIRNAYDAIAQRLEEFRKRHAGSAQDQSANQSSGQQGDLKPTTGIALENPQANRNDNKNDSNRSLLEALPSATPTDSQKFESVLQSLGLNLGTNHPKSSINESLTAQETRALKDYLTQIITFAINKDIIGVYSNLKLAIRAFSNKQLPNEPPNIDLAALPAAEVVKEDASLDGRFQSLVKTSVGHGPTGTDAATEQKIEPIHQLQTAAVTPDGKSIPTPSVTDGKTTVIEVPNSVLESPEAAIVTLGSNGAPKFPPKESFNTPNAQANTLQEPANGEEIVEVKCGDRIIKLNCARDDAAKKVVDKVVEVLDTFGRVKQGVKDITKQVQVVNEEIDNVAERIQEQADRVKRRRARRKRHRKWLAQMKRLQKMQKQKEVEEESKGGNQQDTNEETTKKEVEDRPARDDNDGEVNGEKGGESDAEKAEE